MVEPVVDVTIAVHSRTRPISRAVSSVLEHTEAPVRVNVVAHNIDPAIIRENLGTYANHPQLRLLHLADGIGSPAGPMNFGFANSTAPFITVLGSDDEFAPGAIDSWLATQRKTGAEVVLARIQLDNGRTDPYPPVRRGRRLVNLHPRKDRLCYRSAPLGLIDRSRFGDLRLTEGLPSGEDLNYSMTLWFTGRNIAYDLEGPPYVINGDAADRVTTAPRPLRQDFAYLDELETLPWFTHATNADRRAVAVKLIRIHIFDAILIRTRSQEQIEANRADLLALLDHFETLAPGVTGLLSRADRNAIDELRRAGATPESIALALDKRHVYLSLPTLLPRNLLRTLHRQAPFRTLFAGFRIMNA